MSISLARVRAIVTGGASGLGRHFVCELLRAGATVAAGDIDTVGLAKLASDTASLSGTLSTEQLDVTDERSVRSFVDGAARHAGAPTLLINSAGVLLDGLLVQEDEGWVRRLPLAQWKHVVDVNLTGTFLMMREVAAAMIQGKIADALCVNLSSLVRHGNAGQSAYSASKAAIDAATRSWAIELAPYGIRVVAIAPGVVQTPMLSNISAEAKEKLLGNIPLRRFATPEAIWVGVRFAIECDFVSGRTLEIDGAALPG